MIDLFFSEDSDNQLYTGDLTQPNLYITGLRDILVTPKFTGDLTHQTYKHRVNRIIVGKEILEREKSNYMGSPRHGNYNSGTRRSGIKE